MNYLIQPDSANTCCDCPDRASPCDDCAACELPECDCAHAMCCSFNPDGPMVGGYWDNGEILKITNNFPNPGLAFFPYFYDSGGTIAGLCIDHPGSLSTGNDCLEVAMTEGEFFGQWHSITAKICGNGSELSIEFTAYGQTETFTWTPDTSLPGDNIFVGSSFPSNDQAISIRAISVQPGFSFPDDAFDNTIGSGQSIVGSDTVRIESGSSTHDGYQKSATMDVLNCCDATLLCDTISYSAKACGFEPLHTGSGSPDCYQEVQRNVCGQGTTTGVDPVDCASRWYTQTSVKVGCTPSPGLSCCNVTGTVTQTIIADPDLCDGSAIITDETGSFTIQEDPPGCNCREEVGGDCDCPGEITDVPCSGDCDGCPGAILATENLACITETITASEEITDDTLCEIAVNHLPEYPGTFDGDCSASRDLDTVSSVHSCTIQRFKYKLTFFDPPDAGYKLCWNEHFVPDVGSPVDTPRDFTFDGIVTETDVLEVLEPDEDGEITITDIVCDCA